MTSVLGIHHITAIGGNAQSLVDFYVKLLRQRLVKRTVNYDDPSTYHLYFGDETGSPGTILTFFPWDGVPRGTIGPGQVTEITYSIPSGSMEAWTQWLSDEKVEFRQTSDAEDTNLVIFTDPDGLPLALRESHEAGTDFRTDAFHSARLTVASSEETEAVLEDFLGYERQAEHGSTLRYGMAGVSGSFLDLDLQPNAKLGQMGIGTVHHIAFRVASDEDQLEMRERLARAGFHVSSVMERHYFKSIYFREPGGILFEIATDGPGFMVDEPLDSLGQSLMLPGWLESQRSEIESLLPPLTA